MVFGGSQAAPSSSAGMSAGGIIMIIGIVVPLAVGLGEALHSVPLKHSNLSGILNASGHTFALGVLIDPFVRLRGFMHSPSAGLPLKPAFVSKAIVGVCLLQIAARATCWGLSCIFVCHDWQKLGFQMRIHRLLVSIRTE